MKNNAELDTVEPSNQKLITTTECSAVEIWLDKIIKILESSRNGRGISLLRAII